MSSLPRVQKERASCECAYLFATLGEENGGGSSLAPGRPASGATPTPGTEDWEAVPRHPSLLPCPLFIGASSRVVECLLGESGRRRPERGPVETLRGRAGWERGVPGRPSKRAGSCLEGLPQRLPLHRCTRGSPFSPPDL
ncbi:hypothetical protein HPB47_021441 [Ixodes persulcatus]|uniref:Uncharacterized protein n=1 Tax=Ixodes persulcatus TaxID=34615 RepID=A0AC60QCR5_IXOPE|nr:hypothetical protein HPB47_021441 [Ixodes persulcatus]